MSVLVIYLYGFFFAESSCKNLTCLNSGYCVGDLQGHANCVCQGGHTGTVCSVGMLIPAVRGRAFGHLLCKILACGYSFFVAFRCLKKVTIKIQDICYIFDI